MQGIHASNNDRFIEKQLEGTGFFDDKLVDRYT